MPRIAECREKKIDRPTTCVEEALARQARCRERYRRLIGTAYAADAYANLLEATRAVLSRR